MAEEVKGDTKSEEMRSSKSASTFKYEGLNSFQEGGKRFPFLESDLDRMGITSKDNPEGQDSTGSATAVQCLSPSAQKIAEYEDTLASYKETLRRLSAASLPFFLDDIGDRGVANLTRINAPSDTLNLIKETNPLETPMDHLEGHKEHRDTVEGNTGAKEIPPPPSPISLKKLEVLAPVASPSNMKTSEQSDINSFAEDNPTPPSPLKIREKSIGVASGGQVAREAIAAIADMGHLELSVSGQLERKQKEKHSSCPTLKLEEECCLTPKASNRQQTMHIRMTDLVKVITSSNLFGSNQEKMMKSSDLKKTSERGRRSAKNSGTGRRKSSSSLSIPRDSKKGARSSSLSTLRDAKNRTSTETSPGKGSDTKTSSGRRMQRRSPSLSTPRDSKNGASTEASPGKGSNTRTGRRMQRRSSSLSIPTNSSERVNTEPSPSTKGRSTSASPRRTESKEWSTTTSGKDSSSLSKLRKSNRGEIRKTSRRGKSATTSLRKSTSFGESLSSASAFRLTVSNHEKSTTPNTPTTLRRSHGKISASLTSSRTYRIDIELDAPKHTATGRARSDGISQSESGGISIRRRQTQSDSDLVALGLRDLESSRNSVGTTRNTRRRDRREQRMSKACPSRAALESFVAAKAEEESKQALPAEEDEKLSVEEEESSDLEEENDGGRNETKSTASKVSKLGRSVVKKTRKAAESVGVGKGVKAVVRQTQKTAKVVGKNTTKFLRKDKEGPECRLPILERVEKEGGVAMSA